MADNVLNKNQTFEELLPDWPDDPLPEILDHLESSNTKIVVLDDDPTGTQTIHGLPVLTGWDVESLKKELTGDHRAFFILTNSRALNQADAKALARNLGNNLKLASSQTKIRVSIISRSDSTLRGHFPAEVDEMAHAFGNGGLPYLICPFFLEGGRFTLDDIHYVAQGNNLVPAAKTPYAKDAGFGFDHSHLGEWIEEKTLGRIKKDRVTRISLKDIRNGGPEKVSNILTGVEKNSACFVNAVSYRDIEVLVAGLLQARKKGCHFLYRTAASFVRVRTGVIPKPAYLTSDELTSGTRNGGLFVVGSYVPKTTAQLEQLIAKTDITPVEVNVRQLLDPLQRLSTIRKATQNVNQAIKSGRDTVVYTSRELVKSDDPEESIKIGQIISQSLIRIVQMVDCQPGYLVAKGGITSSDLATVGLKVKRAVVSGQVLAGVPVWRLGKESVHPGMSYVIFPGNVGDDNALALIQRRLRSKGGAANA